MKYRLKFKKLVLNICFVLGCSFFVFFLIVLSYSYKYKITPVVVTKIFLREATLEILEIFYEYYNPWDTKRKVAVLCPHDNQNDSQFFIRSKYDLETIIKIKKLPWTIVKFNNYYPYRSKYNFFYAPYDPFRIKKAFATLSGLSEIAQIQNDFERAIALRNFVKSLWHHGTSGADFFDPKDFDALKIIELAHQGKKFWCQVYALVYTELANYVGLVSRLVMLSSEGYKFDHGVVETWSNLFNKWVLMDPDFNIHYELNGIPLNAVELHNIWSEKKWNLVKVIKGFPRPVGYDVETRSKYKLINLYAYVRIDLRNDYYWNRFPKGHPSVSDENTLLWYDPIFPPILSFEMKTNKYSDFYWSLNYVRINIDPFQISNNLVPMLLDTCTPWFSYYWVVIDNKKQIKLNSNRYSWYLHNGINRFKVCPVNKFGYKGICSEIAIKVNKFR